MVELAIVAAIISILTAMAIPVVRYTVKRQDELELRFALRTMRDAIDKYKQYSDSGLIAPQLGTEGFPTDLQVLVDGVSLVGQINKKQKFLRRIPVDPMTKKAEWGMRSFQDEPDTTAWFALRMGPRMFGIFDAFANERGRDAHLQGKLARQITSKADLFVKMPEMQRVEVLADKLPH